MANFLHIALRNAARGFRIVPLRGKDAFLKGWPQLASSNEAVLRAWGVKYPECNVGVCGGPDTIIVDTDRLSRLRELCGANWEA